MNDQRFCPNCGAKLSADATFCPNCGYRFTDNSQPTRTEIRQHIYDNAANDDSQNDGDNYGGSNNPDQQPPHKKHNKLVITLIIIIVLLLIGGGVAAYKLVLTPGHPNTASSSSSSSHSSSASSSSATSASTSSASTSSASTSSAQSTISADDTNSIMSDVFSTVGNSVSEDDAYVDQISDEFVNGTSNPSYKGLEDWANAQTKNNDIDSVDMSVQDLTTTGNKANFKVKYVFHQTGDNPNHVQIFAWHAQMRQDDNGDLKIVSCTANNKAISDYDE
ncbi:zinc ribbon domain-containing protein [Lactobacillaceae bacterium Melli_B4]